MCVGVVLRDSPRVKDIACSGRVDEVRSAFSEVMQAIVDLASNQPAACINTIALLSIISYTRGGRLFSEERISEAIG